MTKAKPQRRTQEERSATTKAEIIRGAIECLNEFGYRGATTPVIMKRVGLSLGALNHHFTDRQDLMLAVCEYAYEERASFLQPAVHKDQPLDVRFRDVASALWRAQRRPSQRAYVEILVAAKSNPEMLVPVGRYFERFDYDNQKFWLAAFDDVDASKDLLIRLRDLLLSSVRGMLVTMPFMQDDGYFEEQIEYFCECALLRIKADQADATSSKPPRRSK